MASQVPSSWVVFTLRGELDMSRTDELDEMVASAFQGDHVNAMFDLSDVSFMDSSALRWFLRIQDRIDQVGGRLRLVAPEGGSLMRLLSLTGLDGRFEVFPTPIEAEPDSSGPTDEVDSLLATLAAPGATSSAMSPNTYKGDVWERATEAGYTEWTGLGHRLTDKGRARVSQGSMHP